MVSIFDVAEYFLKRKKEISVWKLNCLCYYAQAWHVAWTGRRLIKEEFTLKETCVVCKELCKYLSGKFMIHAEDITRAITPLDADEKESADIVLKEYGDYQPYEICPQTAEDVSQMKEQKPTLENMREYYSKLLEQLERNAPTKENC